MIEKRDLNPMEFIRNAPLLPIFLFILLIFFFVALAYFIAGKQMLSSSLADGLKNDTAF